LRIPTIVARLIAVTGATGFIGGLICRQLAAAGYRVRVLVRTPHPAPVLQDIGAEQVTGSLEDSRSLERLADGADAVVHCAGAVRGATREHFERVNVAGVRRLLQVLESLDKPPRLLSLSSLAAREPQLSYYAASKHAGEQVLVNEARRVAWIALRPPAVYGPGDRELLPLFRLMAKGVAPVPGSLTARFSLLYAGDLAAAVVAWLESERVASGVYTIDDGRSGGYDWPAVAAVVSRLCRRRVQVLQVPSWLLGIPAWLNSLGGRLFGYAPMLTPEKLRELRHPDWVCDSAALMKQIEWRPRTQLEEGLRATPGWPGYREEQAA
jgi:nucleoside-diphosphate-sugar epimerase